jgi:hypothetical protein
MEKLLALSVLALTVFGSTLGACDRLRGLGNRVRTGCPRMGRAAGSFGSICSPRLVGTAVFRAASANLLPSALASAHWPTRTGQRALASAHSPSIMTQKTRPAPAPAPAPARMAADCFGVPARASTGYTRSIAKKSVPVREPERYGELL